MFGAYIKYLRKSNNLTLTQLGAKLNIDSGALSKIENGKKIFDERKLELLSNIFNLDYEEVKNEYFSEKIANEVVAKKCSKDILYLAEKKIDNIIKENANQLYLNLK